METTLSSESSFHIRPTRHHISENGNIHFQYSFDFWNLKGSLECSTNISFSLCDGELTDLTLLSNPVLERVESTQGCTFSLQTFITNERSLQLRLLFIFTSLDTTMPRLLRTDTDIYTNLPIEIEISLYRTLDSFWCFVCLQLHIQNKFTSCFYCEICFS
jgi:hypothetical protein